MLIGASAIFGISIFGIIISASSWSSSSKPEPMGKPTKAAPVPGEWSEMPLGLPGSGMALVSVESEESVRGERLVSYGALSVRCVAGYVAVVFEPDPSRLPNQTIHYRLDDGPLTAIHANMAEKDDAAMLGFVPLAKRLISASTLSADFVSDGGIRRTATFKLRGFRDVEERIREACPAAGLPRLRR